MFVELFYIERMPDSCERVGRFFAPNYLITLDNSSKFVTIIRQEGDNGNEGVDLKLSIIGDGAEVVAYQDFSVEVVVMNEGTTTSDNVVVNVPQPANVVFQGGNPSSATQGSYNSFSTFNWRVGTFAPCQSETLTLTLTLNYFSLAGAPYTVYGQVQSASGTDY